MNGQQQLVGAAGIGLVAVNYWFGGAKGQVSAGLFNAKSGQAGEQTAHDTLKQVGAELLFVGVMTLLAGLSDAWGSAMVAIIVGLWLLWLILRYGGGPAKTTSTGSAPVAL